MSRELTYLLGERHDRPYFLVARATPDFERVDDFAVVVYYNQPATEQRIEIARIDTAHGFTHFDKLYRRDQPKEPVSLELWDAVELMDANWRRYADRYDAVHDE